MRGTLVSFAFAGLAVLLAPVGLDAQCRREDLRGGFVFTVTGLTTQPEFIAGPIAHVGRVLFDGEGKHTAATFVSYNGLIVDEPFDGTYTVNSDCTGTFVANIPPPLDAVVGFKTLLSRDFQDLSFMVTSPPGSAVVGVMRKQRTPACTAADLIGTYAFEMSGQISQLPERPVGFARFGKLVADGAGRFTATTTGSYNGAIVTENFSGTYSVNSNCIVSIRYELPTTAGTTSFLLWGGLFDAGDGAYLIQREPAGTTNAGSLLHAPRR